MTTVTVKVNKAAIRRILDRTRSELRSWAGDVMRRTRPLTPVNTGQLRTDVAVEVIQDEQTTQIWWHWKVPYAWFAETMRERGASPRTPGTIAPFAVPGVEEAVKEEIAKPIAKAFKGE